MRVMRVNAESPDRGVLEEAAALLRAGRLVVFPTETVYGLGANALDPDAVKRVYAAKGRPSVNPLIVHVPDVHAARSLCAEWTPVADRLARAYWPGPLTLVLRRRPVVPDVVTAGLDTVALRVPSHPVALALLAETGLPLAAPSANLSTQVSPTTAVHVQRGLGDQADLIIDAGPTEVGIESTVVDATGEQAVILRPGMISASDIARVLGAPPASAASAERPRSPGLHGRHYAPRARVVLFTAEDRDAAFSTARDEIARGGRAGAIALSPLAPEIDPTVLMPRDPESYARALYATLHAIDDAGCTVVLIERPPASPEWLAIVDRLERAAH